MVLYRLLSRLPSDKYSLISRESYEGNQRNNPASSKLRAKYYHLKPIFQLPVLSRLRLSALCIAINAIVGICVRAKQIEKIARREQFELLIACTGDLYDLPATYLASKRLEIPLVPYLFDDYSYQWVGFTRFISRRLEPAILRHAANIIVPNEFMQREYMKRYGLHSTVIHNPSPLPDLEMLDRADSMFKTEQINIVYAGAVYHAHYDAFRNLIAAIEQLKGWDVKLHLYTAQPESLLKQNRVLGDMIVYHSHINQSEISTVLRQADILFLPLAFQSPIPEVIRTSAPGKIGEYLSVGRPVLVHAPSDTFISWYFREHHCGLVVDKNDPAILAEEIRKLLSHDQKRLELGERARKMAEKDFSIDKMTDAFLGLMNVLSTSLNKSSSQSSADVF